MPIKEFGTFNSQTGVTAGTSDAILLRPNLPVSITLQLTAGSPATGAKIEVTNSQHTDIRAGTAVWVTPSALSNTKVTDMYVNSSGNSCQFTGVRLVVTDGTWSIFARQE